VPFYGPERGHRVAGPRSAIEGMRSCHAGVTAANSDASLTKYVSASAKRVANSRSEPKNSALPGMGIG
jgi:hypothetical protein